MQDAGGVRVHERLEQRGGDREGLRKRQRPAPQAIAQRLARDELHREEGHAVGFAGLEERGDRRMLKPGARLRLANEPRRAPRPVIDGARTLSAAALPEREIAGEEHFAHAAGAQASSR